MFVSLSVSVTSDFCRVTYNNANLMKACPKCCENINVKKSLCDCGHTFVLKRKASIDATRKSKRIAMRSGRALANLTTGTGAFVIHMSDFI